MKVVHLNKEKKVIPDPKEFAKVLIEKWTKRDRERAEKMYGKKVLSAAADKKG